MIERCQYLQAVVFDWAGTTVDHGSRAPAIVFQEIFRKRGIQITEAQAREPMGMAKRDHIAAIAAMREISAAWATRFGKPASDQEIDAMYAEFLPLQKATLKQHCDVIAGVPEAVDSCREMGLKIGSSTGYTRELMEVVMEVAQQQGYRPDCVLCAEDAPRGRPAPFLLYEAAKRLDVFPMWRIVKVDDTPVGIEAGRNAGCWTVGVTMTGNCVGHSADDLAMMSSSQLGKLCDDAAKRLTGAGAHYTILSAAEMPELIQDIERRLASGETPIFSRPE